MKTKYNCAWVGMSHADKTCEHNIVKVKNGDVYVVRWYRGKWVSGHQVIKARQVLRKIA